MTISWPHILAALAVLAGAAGSVLTPVFGTSLAVAVQAVLQAVSGLLIVIAGGAAVHVVHADALAKRGLGPNRGIVA